MGDALATWLEAHASYKACKPNMTAKHPNHPTPPQVSGMGDALATWFEARTSYEACKPNMLHGSCTITGVALAKLCYETLLEDGPAACAAVEVRQWLS